jgi:hypothetical protein
MTSCTHLSYIMYKIYSQGTVSCFYNSVDGFINTIPWWSYLHPQRHQQHKWIVLIMSWQSTWKCRNICSMSFRHISMCGKVWSMTLLIGPVTYDNRMTGQTYPDSAKWIAEQLGHVAFFFKDYMYQQLDMFFCLHGFLCTYIRTGDVSLSTWIATTRRCSFVNMDRYVLILTTRRCSFVCMDRYVLTLSTRRCSFVYMDRYVLILTTRWCSFVYMDRYVLILTTIGCSSVYTNRSVLSVWWSLFSVYPKWYATFQWRMAVH